MDEVFQVPRLPAPASSPANPSRLFGSVGRDEATGRGVVIALEELLRTGTAAVDATTIFCRGFGNVGSHRAHSASAAGGVIGIGDHTASYYDTSGIRCAERAGLRQSACSPAGRVHRRSRAASSCSKPCDVLVPAALGGVITKDNADKLQCRIIARRCQRSDDDPEADEILPPPLDHHPARHLRQRRRRDRPATSRVGAEPATVRLGRKKVRVRLERVMRNAFRHLSQTAAEALPHRSSHCRLRRRHRPRCSRDRPARSVASPVTRRSAPSPPDPSCSSPRLQGLSPQLADLVEVSGTTRRWASRRRQRRVIDEWGAAGLVGVADGQLGVGSSSQPSRASVPGGVDAVGQPRSWSWLSPRSGGPPPMPSAFHALSHIHRRAHRAMSAAVDGSPIGEFELSGAAR